MMGAVKILVMSMKAIGLSILSMLRNPVNTQLSID